jgi:type VI secretion system VasD/TssJ family lipoprotein
MLVALYIILALSGCSTPRVELAVASQPNVNPDHSGRPSPLIIKMYELHGDLGFKQSDFQSLFNEPVKTLGTDLIAADELVFIPAEARSIAYEPMPETRFVGIIGGFRQMERAHWRVIVPIDPEKTNIIPLELNDTSLILITDDKEWKPEERVRSYQNKTQEPARQQQTTGQPVQGQSDKHASPEGSNTGAVRLDGDTQPAQQQGYVMPKAKRTP